MKLLIAPDLLEANSTIFEFSRFCKKKKKRNNCVSNLKVLIYFGKKKLKVVMYYFNKLYVLLPRLSKILGISNSM